MELKIAHKIKGSPEEVYRALTNPFTIQLWTDAPVTMEEKAGTEFSILGGNITGRNIEFIPNQMIRQVWYFDGSESEVLIKIFPDKSNTRIIVEQSGIPEDAYENILEGWKESYLGPLTDFFEA
ncbi:MAG: SRPBCC domain-containing protein [Bacteroidales bacterium]|nr:SRPBCC domain-containing protein [Bacteroidales bacterium]